MPYSADRRTPPFPIMDAYNTHSYLSPSAAPFTAACARATPDPTPNAPASPNPSHSPDHPSPALPVRYRHWMDPPGIYMDDPSSVVARGYADFPNYHDILPSEVPGFMQQHPLTDDDSDFMEENYGIDKKLCSTPPPLVNPYTEYSFGICLPQLMSCSAYPPTAASPEVCAAAKAVSSTPDDHILENTYSRYMIPHRFNLDTMPNAQKDFVGSLSAYEQCVDWSSLDIATRITGKYPLRSHMVGENCLIDDGSGTGIPVQSSSEVKSDLRSLQASCSKSFLPELAFAQPRDIYTEPLEVNNPVDSPCWKGTPTVQRPSFDGLKNNDATYSATGTVDLYYLHQSHNLPEFCTSNTVLCSEYHDTSNAENHTCLPYCNNYVSAFSLPCKKSDGHSDTEPSSVGTVNGMDNSNHAGYVSLEQGSKRDNHRTCTAGDDSENVVTEGQQGSVFPDKKTNYSIVFGGTFCSHIGSIGEESARKVPFSVGAAPAAHVGSLIKESPQKNTLCTHKPAATCENMRSKIFTNRGLEHLTHWNPVDQMDLMKTSAEKETCRSTTQAEVLNSMHSLTVMLLSSCNGSYELEESEYELAQSVIQNLNCFNSKLSKAALKLEDVDSNCCLIKSEKMMCNRKICQHEKFAELDSGHIGADFEASVLQDLSKLREDNMVSATKDEQMLVYKNLWIEAEASICKLKYELQHTRMKLPMKCQGQQTASTPMSSSGESKAPNLTKHESSLCVGELDDLSKHQNPLKENNICSTTLLPQGVASCDGQTAEVNRCVTDKADAAVFDRLKVLKLRDESMSSFYEGNSELQKETGSCKTGSVNDSVIDNAYDNGMYSLVEDIIKKRLRESNSEGDETDDATVAILKHFIGYDINTCSLGEDVNQDLPISGENKADGAVAARLENLMACSDNISSAGNDNARQTSFNNGCAHFEDGLLARLQVLKRCGDNTSSGLEAQQQILPLENWFTEQADFQSDVYYSAISDDANAKSADLLSTMVEESHLFSGPTEPGGLDTYSSDSPSEWEHVLKEDFFLPGKEIL